MEYLIKYSAYTDHSNGYYVHNYEQIEKDLDNVCEKVASLEDMYKDDENFTYEIFQLSECNKELVTKNIVYKNAKIKLEKEEIIRELYKDISSKKYEISNQEHTKNKYGKWEKYDEQMLLMENDLKVLENKLDLHKKEYLLLCQ